LEVLTIAKKQYYLNNQMNFSRFHINRDSQYYYT